MTTQTLARPDWTHRLANLFAVLLTLVGALWILDVPRRLGRLYYTEQYLLVMLGLGLSLAYLIRAVQAPEALRGLSRPLALAGSAAVLAVTGYAAASYEALMMSSASMAAGNIAIGVAITTAIIVAVYLVTGRFLAGVVAFFLVQTHYAGDMPAFLQGRSVSWERIFAYLSVDSTATLGLPLQIATNVVLTFILFGVLISRLGGGEFFTDLAMRSVGKYRGGSAKVAVIGSGFFGSVSGSAVANIVATGVVTIPLMQRSGYRAAQAGAVEAVASTGGQLLPPVMGAAAFLMAEFLQVSYGTVLIHALIPALLYYAAVLCYVDLLAGRDRIAPLGDVDLGENPQLGRRALVYLTPFAVLLFAMFSFNRRPEEAALLGSLALFVLWALPIIQMERKYSLRALWDFAADVGRAMVDIIVICAAAGIIIGLVNIAGSAFALSLFILDLGGTSLLAVLFFTAVMSVILGMGMPTVGVYVLLATLAAPAMVKLGVEPVGAHLFVLYFGILSMLTPPVAVASYVASSLAKSNPMTTSLEAIKAGWIAFVVPFLFIYSPSLLMIGAPVQIALTVLTALAGVWLITGSFVGFHLADSAPWQRLALGFSGAGMLVPVQLFAGAWACNLAGLAAATLLVLAQRRDRIAAVPTTEGS